MQLKELYLSGKESMSQGLIESPGLESYLLLSKITSVSDIADIYTQPEKEIDEASVRRFFELLERRVNNEPSAYIVGYKEFFSRKYLVDNSVLIPRPETELLVDEAIKIHQKSGAHEVLDLGTGSGCIAITIACECPNAAVSASDISGDALRTSKINAQAYGKQNITLIKGDLFKPFKDKSFDLIVSNPPYISDEDFETLEPEVRDYEPKVSLVGGADGLDVIRDIIKNGPLYLKDGGICMLEIGEGQSEKVVDLFRKRGFTEIQTRKDINGILRVVRAKWKK